MSADIVTNVVDSEEKKQKIVRVVPWYNAAQFRKVYQYLYSPELVKKRWALDQISVWETRCNPSLPGAIEATYGLTSAIVQDILWTNGASVNQQLDIQYIYSSAITRFVNLTVELHEEQAYQGTMAQIAKGLGIPSFIIDLRNEAAHSIRPSLSCLRIAAETAMKYLKESYWEKEASRVKNYVKKPVNEAEIRQLIGHYIPFQLHVIYNQEKSPEHDEQNVLEIVRRCLRQIEFWIKKNKRMFIKVLVTDGLFIPYEDELKYLVSEEEFMLFQGEFDEEDANNPSYKSSIIPSVPDFHEALWLPVIAILSLHDAVPLFLESLLRTQADRTVVGQKLLISWVMRILRIHAVGGCFEVTRLKKIFRKKGIVANWHSMFYAAVVNPCKYTPFVLPLIFCHLDLNRGITHRILNLVAIYLGQTKDDDFHIPHNIFTVEQLKQIKQLQKAEREKKTGISDDSLWSLAPDDSHKAWPIGCVINHIDSEENEEQPLDEDIFEAFVEREDFTEKFIFSNENDNIENYCIIQNDRPDTFEDDIIKELNERKTFLYRK